MRTPVSRHDAAGAATLVVITALVAAYVANAPRIGLPTLGTTLGTLARASHVQPPGATATIPAAPERPVRITGGEPVSLDHRPIATNAQASVPDAAAAPRREGSPKPGPVVAGLTLSDVRPAPASAPSPAKVSDGPRRTPLASLPVQERTPLDPVRTPPVPDMRQAPAPVPGSSPFAMQTGQIVRGGLQMPGLLVELSVEQIKALVASGRVIVFAESRNGDDLAFLDGSTHQFRAISEWKQTVSDRFLVINDPGLTAGWQVLAQSVTLQAPDRFGLRFRSDFDAEIREAQMRALASQGIDFSTALRQGQVVEVHGTIGPQLAFEADRVSVR